MVRTCNARPQISPAASVRSHFSKTLVAAHALFCIFPGKVLKDKGHDAGKKALDQVQNVVDRGAYLAHGLEDVAMEYHLPLDASFRGEEGGGIDRELQAERRTCGKTHRRTPY